MYAFQSCGALSYGIFDEINWEASNTDLSNQDRLELAHLLLFIGQQEVDEDGERGPQDNWHEATRWDFGDQDALFEDGDGR